MSIQHPPLRFLVNHVATGAVTVSNNIITIANMEGLAPFPVANVQECSRVCSSDCTKQKYTITPTVPSTPCECPWTWHLSLQMNTCPQPRTDRYIGRSIVYTHTSPVNSIPTVNEIVEAIVADINADPYRQFVAVPTGSPGAYTAFTVEELDCDSFNATCGFRASAPSGTVVNTTPGVAAVLNFADMKRLWAELPGYFFGNQPAPIEDANYCLYRMRVVMPETPGPHLANEWAKRTMDLEFYVNNTANSQFWDNWDTPLAAVLSCFSQLEPTS